MKGSQKKLLQMAFVFQKGILNSFLSILGKYISKQTRLSLPVGYADLHI